MSGFCINNFACKFFFYLDISTTKRNSMKNYFALIIIIICCSTYYNAFVLFVGIVRIFCEVYCNAMRNHRVKAINLQRDFPLLGEIMKWHIYLNCVYFTPSLHAHARHKCVNQIDSLFTHCCNNKEYTLFCALIIKGSKKGFFWLWWHIMFCGEDNTHFLL